MISFSEENCFEGRIEIEDIYNVTTNKFFEHTKCIGKLKVDMLDLLMTFPASKSPFKSVTKNNHLTTFSKVESKSEMHFARCEIRVRQ